MQFSSPSLFDLAAIYGYHICKNHAFIDGNKRTAAAAMMVFLEYNAFRITASKDDIIAKILAIECNEINKQQLANWLASNTVKILSH
jgi:death-on-curing protein